MGRLFEASYVLSDPRGRMLSSADAVTVCSGVEAKRLLMSTAKSVAVLMPEAERQQ